MACLRRISVGDGGNTRSATGRVSAYRTRAMGFFQRRAKRKADDAAGLAARELVAQCAARDLAVAVLIASDEAEMPLKQLPIYFSAVLASNAPRGAVDRGLARAIALDAELRKGFPSVPPKTLHAATIAAMGGGPEDLIDYADDLGMSVEAARATLLECANLTDDERQSISEAGMPNSLVREPVKQELVSLVAADPPLVPDGYTADLLVSLLDNLLRQRVGAFARLGNETGAPWILLPDTFESLRSLTDDERRTLSGPCGYVRQMTMLPTMMVELLEARP